MIAISQLNSFAKIRESFFDPTRSFAWSATRSNFRFFFYILLQLFNTELSCSVSFVSCRSIISNRYSFMIKRIFCARIHVYNRSKFQIGLRHVEFKVSIYNTLYKIYLGDFETFYDIFGQGTLFKIKTTCYIMHKWNNASVRIGYINLQQKYQRLRACEGREKGKRICESFFRNGASIWLLGVVKILYFLPKRDTLLQLPVT